MKFKLDENFGQSVLEVFTRRGFDCHTVHDEGLTGAEDPDVLAAATAEDRVLVTLDRDFTNVLLHPPEATSGIVVVQLGRRLTRSLLVASIETFLTACEQNLLRGKLWIVEPGRIREHRTDDEDDDGDPA